MRVRATYNKIETVILIDIDKASQSLNQRASCLVVGRECPRAKKKGGRVLW